MVLRVTPLLTDRDINSPIRVLLLGSDTDIGTTFLQHANALTEFSVTPIDSQTFLADQGWHEDQQETYDFLVDALSVGKPFASNYLEKITELQQWAERNSIHAIMLSSVQVFSGMTDHSYEETDTPDNDSKYAQNLIQIEQRFLSYHENIVLRSGWLFGGTGNFSQGPTNKENNFAQQTIDFARNAEALPYRDDFTGCPTPISDLIRVVFSLIKQRHYGAKNTGVYHYCCAEEVSWKNYAKAILMVASQYDNNIDGQDFLDEYESNAVGQDVRQSKQSLSCRQIFNHFGVKQRPWRTNLKNFIKGLYQDE
ncbi:dTDP-4-dehydrorhamnose reductase [Marinomonas agarivorans]|nr:dTDP-4-dehydrorhamnose reductase [Marinomonas agarivorans]